MTDDAEKAAAQEAHDKIEAAKEKFFGVANAKAAFEKEGANKLRQDLSNIESLMQMNKLTEQQYK